MLHSTAPGSFQPVLSEMINDGVSIISNSWAYCEDQTTQADVQGIDTILQNAAMAGISVFTAPATTAAHASMAAQIRDRRSRRIRRT